MAEWKFFDGDIAPFTDDEFYREREAAHHMEQIGHRDRLIAVLAFAMHAKKHLNCLTFSDQGAGDGGLIQEARFQGLDIWGYDMQPSNVDYARSVRKVPVELVNFETDGGIVFGDASILSEVLEHVSDPHGLVRNLPSNVIIASSPYLENPDNRYEFHNWAWDMDGYAELIKQGGYEIVRHETAWFSQVILGVRR